MEAPTDPELRRFVIELEFVQCLANFGYLHFLAQRRYLEDENFVAYLRYLRYWASPPCVPVLSLPRARRLRRVSRARHTRTRLSRSISRVALLACSYAKFVTYPDALEILNLLVDSSAFRAELRQPALRDHGHRAQYDAWRARDRALAASRAREDAETSAERARRRDADLVAFGARGYAYDLERGFAKQGR